jgi:hypothetical protein
MIDDDPGNISYKKNNENPFEMAQDAKKNSSLIVSESKSSSNIRKSDLSSFGRLSIRMKERISRYGDEDILIDFGSRHTAYLISIWFVFVAVFICGFIVHFETDNSVTSQPNDYHIRLEGASVTYKNYESLKLDVRYVSKYEYDTYLGRFKFNVTITNESIPLNTLTRIPTHYLVKIASSSCILIESKKFECTVIYEPQKIGDNFYIPQSLQLKIQRKEMAI